MMILYLKKIIINNIMVSYWIIQPIGTITELSSTSYKFTADSSGNLNARMYGKNTGTGYQISIFPYTVNGSGVNPSVGVGFIASETEP